MLKGRDLAWFQVYRDAVEDMAVAQRARPGNPWHGILADSDLAALRYQLAHGRALRAKRALAGPGLLRSPRFTGYGWEDTTPEEQRREFLAVTRYRSRARRMLKP